jgi:hypothetical protein
VADLVELTGGAAASGTSATTASISPTANRPVFACILSSRNGGTAPAAPGLSGAGLTWTLLDDETVTEFPFGTCRLSVFRGVNASPSTGALSIDFSGENQDGIAWTILDGDGLDAAVQDVGANATSGTTATVTLAAFANPSNYTLLAVGNSNVAVNIDCDSPLTDYTQRSAGEVILRAGFYNAEETTPSATLSGTHAWVAIGVEIGLAAGGGPTINTQPTAQTVVLNNDARTSATFTVAATTSGGALSYQWQVDDGGGFDNISNGGIYSGATSTSLVVTPTNKDQNGYDYRCNVTDSNGTTATNAVALTVYNGVILSATSGTTNGSGVATITYTTDLPVTTNGAFNKFTATAGAAVSRTSGRPS